MVKGKISLKGPLKPVERKPSESFYSQQPAMVEAYKPVESPPREVERGDEKQRRKAPEELKAELYPIRLQLPVTKEQNLLLTRIAQELQLNRAGRGEAINKNTVTRCLINLLEDIEITEADVVSSEQDVEQLIRAKLGLR
jgi:hypothetical protein